MRKSILIAVLTGLIMAGLLMGMPSPAQAQLLKLSVGVSQVNVIWQTSPPPFVEITRWGGIGLSVLLERITLSTGVTVVDFQTMRLTSPPSFYFETDFTLAQLNIRKLFIGGGAVIVPSLNWIGWYLNTGLTVSLTRTIDVSGAIVVEKTVGPPAGMGIGFKVSVFWSYPLL